MTIVNLEERFEEFKARTGFSCYFDDMEKEILDGYFAEGEMVTVKVDGHTYRRRVRYSARKYADLYIMIRGYAFTFTDFYRSEE